VFSNGAKKRKSKEKGEINQSATSGDAISETTTITARGENGDVRTDGSTEWANRTANCAALQ